MNTHTLAAGLLTLAAAGSAASQSSPRMVAIPPRAHLPLAPIEESAAIPLARFGTGDFDADGDLDLTLSWTFRPTEIWTNDGDAVFHFRERLGRGSYSAAADFDGDGFDELIVGGAYYDNLAGSWSRPDLDRFAPLFVASPPLGILDVDGDADLDIVSSGSLVYLNDGNGRFQALTAPFPSATAHDLYSEMLDVDGDGDADIVRQTLPPRLELLSNVGDGTFWNTPPQTFAPAPPAVNYRQGLAAADLDSDGRNDLIATWSGPGNVAIQLLMQRPGGFVDETAARFPTIPFASVPGLVDANADGHVDVLLRHNQERALFLNDGSGVFSAAPPEHPLLTRRLLQIHLSEDLDGNGFDDLLLGNSHDLWLADGRGAHSIARRQPFADQGWGQPAIADLDGNGHLDVFTGTGVYLQDRDGRFIRDASLWTAQLSGGHRSELVDVDGDGDLDLIALDNAFLFYLLRVFENDGNGRLTQVWQGTNPDGTGSSLDVGDLNGDGRPDLLIGLRRFYGSLTASGAHVWLADASGPTSWTVAPHALPPTREVDDLELLDFDGDLDLDLFCARTGTNSLFENDGFGTFVDRSLSHLPHDVDPSARVAIGDLNRDGFDDVVVANFGGTFRVYEGSAAHGLRGIRSWFAGTTRGPAEPNDLAIGDLDLDGRPDLVCAGAETVQRPGRQVVAFRQDAAGRSFADVTSSWLETEDLDTETTDIAIEDFDGDGAPDLLLRNGREFGIRFNLSARPLLETPRLPRLGRRYEVLVRGLSFGAGASSTTQLFVGRPLAVPTRTVVGLLGIDPLTALPVETAPPSTAPSNTSPPSTRAVATFNLPNNPAFLGLELAWQALDSPAPGAPARLSNTLRDVITR